MDQLADIIQSIILALGYPGVAIIMFVENVFPPIPSELVMPFAGFVAGRGELDFFLVWFWATVATVLGAIVLYYFGMKAGDPVIRNILRRYGLWLTLTESDYDTALDYFTKRGEIIILLGRLIPIIRSLISVPAGANRMPMGKFLIYTTIGTGIWNFLLGYAGLVLGEQWETILDVLDQYQLITMIILIIIGTIVLVWYVRRLITTRRRDAELRASQNPEE